MAAVADTTVLKLLLYLNAASPHFFKNKAGILLGIAVSLQVHHFTLNLLVFLNLTCVSCRQHIIGSCFLFNSLYQCLSYDWYV